MNRGIYHKAREAFIIKQEDIPEKKIEYVNQDLTNRQGPVKLSSQSDLSGRNALLILQETAFTTLLQY